MVVFACLANFLCDSIDPQAREFAQILSDNISHHLNDVRKFADSHPDKPVVVVRPLLRQKPLWYLNQFALLTDIFEDLFRQIKTSNLHMFTVPAVLDFDDELVHLSPTCGENYVCHILDQCWEILNSLSLPPLPFKQATSIDTDSDCESVGTSFKLASTPNVSSGVTMEMLLAEIRKNNVVQKVNDQELRLNQLSTRVLSGFRSTDLAISKLHEDQDFYANTSKENRVTIGSLVIHESVPSDRAGWISLITTKVQLVINESFKSDAPFVPKLIGVAIRSTKLNFKKEFPNFDAIFENSTHALCFRRTVGILARQDKSPHKLFVSNCVTLSTRVRIEVLLALSRHLNKLGFVCHVQSFVSRPVIHIKPRESNISKVYTYTDCIKKYGNYFDSVDLSGAYKRAGDFFSGTLSRYFVVLKDDVANQVQKSVRSKRPLGKSDRPVGKKQC